MRKLSVVAQMVSPWQVLPVMLTIHLQRLDVLFHLKAPIEC